MARAALTAGLAVFALGRVAAAAPSPDAVSALPLAEVTDVREISLADLLDTRVDIASNKPQTTRETPGIVTVITRDDILSSGARDLLDVLTLVPGFSPGIDIMGVVDLGVRGQWGHEGKIQLLVDGQPVNELMYSSLQLSNHYPLEAIDHIEVIRGPGSVIYGGYAELAVINLITRDAASLEGVAVAGSYGQLGSTVGHANASLAFGTTSTGIKDLSAAGSLVIGHATSTGTYRDFVGGMFAMAGNTDRDPLFVKLAIKYRRLHVDAIIDEYAMQTRDAYGTVDSVTARMAFRAYALDVRYEIPIADHLTLTPRLDVLRQDPWLITNQASINYYDKTISRYTAGLRLAYDPTRSVNLVVGAETLSDRASVNTGLLMGNQTLFAGQTHTSSDTVAGYAEALVNHSIANLTIGARYEYQSAVGGSLVPRIALTKVLGKFHAKLLASQAFRAPSVENINTSNGDLQPEKTTVFEAETGYELGDHNYAAVNAFDTTIRKPIIYDYNPDTMTELYRNFDHTGTRGVEVDYRIKYPRGSADINYSYYTATGKNAVDAYRVPGHDSVLLAFPAHKIAMSGSVKLYRGLSFNPSAVIYGERYGYTTGNAAGEAVLGRVAPAALVNLYLQYRDAVVPGLDLGAGVYNVADQGYQYLQPYNGGHPPMAALSRELVFRIAYEHKL